MLFFFQGLAIREKKNTQLKCPRMEIRNRVFWLEKKKEEFRCVYIGGLMSFLHFRSLVARNCPLLHVNGKRTQKAALFAPGPLFDSRFSSSSSSLILLPSFFFLRIIFPSLPSWLLAF